MGGSPRRMRRRRFAGRDALSARTVVNNAGTSSRHNLLLGGVEPNPPERRGLDVLAADEPIGHFLVARVARIRPRGRRPPRGSQDRRPALAGTPRRGGCRARRRGRGIRWWPKASTMAAIAGRGAAGLPAVSCWFARLWPTASASSAAPTTTRVIRPPRSTLRSSLCLCRSHSTAPRARRNAAVAFTRHAAARPGTAARTRAACTRQLRRAARSGRGA